MTNPFIIPDRAIDDSRPLCPWQTIAHGSYYARVDHTENAFDVFKSAISAHSDLASRGRVVFVHGPEGCGKTALIHRCAAWLKGELTVERHLATTILDLTADGLRGIDTDGRVAHICKRVIDELELRSLVSKVELDSLQNRQSDPATAYPYLANVLRNGNKVLLVLLPPSEVTEEIARYCDFARSHLVFFCESSYVAVAERFGTSTQYPVPSHIIALGVGVLEVEDGWRFVDARLQAADGSPVPTVTEETIRRFMETRITGRGRTSVRELQMTCADVFERALRAGADSVEYVDFADYYTRRAFIK